MSLEQFAQGMASLSQVNSLSQMPASAQAGIIVLLVWTLIWKGLALWKAGGKQDKIWFTVLLVVNTVGILEIVYIFAIVKKKWIDIQEILNVKKPVAN